MRATRPADESAADEGAVQAIRPVDQDAIRLATILGVASTAALLGVVSVAASLGVAGWIVGLATGWAATALIVIARMRSDQPTIFPADWVTLTRAVLCAGVAGLVAASLSVGRPVPTTALVTLSVVALALDAVDGQVARRTGTANSLGGHFDGEVDAFLILLLSIVVSQS
jgi:phosphatidylglycerophosphate synthase